MTMQVTHSPKPKMFGKGYTKHVASNLRLMKRFFWLGWKMLVNTFIPSVFYEEAHWEVIDLYHKMRGYRHGTNNEKRCNECGTELMSHDDVHDLRDAEELIDELKDRVAELEWHEPHNEDDPYSDK